MRSAQGTIPPLAGDLPRDWRTLRHMTFHRDGFQCVKCGKRGRLECDHIIPREAGGTDDLENLQTLCVRCHIKKTKGDKGQPDPESVTEWDDYVRMSPAEKRKAVWKLRLNKSDKLSKSDPGDSDA